MKYTVEIATHDEDPDFWEALVEALATIEGHHFLYTIKEHVDAVTS